MVAIGWAQEFQLVWDARKRDTDPSKPPQFSFAKADRRVTCYYFYIWDEFWGAGFIKICAYFPYPAKVWLNGHEHAKRMMREKESMTRNSVGVLSLWAESPWFGRATSMRQLLVPRSM